MDFFAKKKKKNVILEFLMNSFKYLWKTIESKRTAILICRENIDFKSTFLEKNITFVQGK